jgi:uncharacterized protein
MSETLCQSCGACCAAFRVSFYQGECDEFPGGVVPSAWTEQVNNHMVCMRGTDRQPPRCAALGGDVGVRVNCRIYEWRSSTCRDFVVGSVACNDARRRWGLLAV